MPTMNETFIQMTNASVGESTCIWLGRLWCSSTRRQGSQSHSISGWPKKNPMMTKGMGASRQ